MRREAPPWGLGGAAEPAARSIGRGPPGREGAEWATEALVPRRAFPLAGEGGEEREGSGINRRGLLDVTGRGGLLGRSGGAQRAGSREPAAAGTARRSE